MSKNSEGCHIDNEPVLNVALQHALVGRIDVGHGNQLDVGGDAVLCAEIQHFLGFPDASDQGTRDLPALKEALNKSHMSRVAGKSR